MKKYFVWLIRLAVTSLLLLALTTCRHSTAPPPPSGPDTTTHDFVWQTYFFGEGNPSHLRDAAIINDTLAYAVGEIYLKDSSGQIDPLQYNAIAWDGRTWQIERINVALFGGNVVPSPLQGIFSFSPSDIWVMGGFPIHGDGQNWLIYHLQSMGMSASVSSAWGTSSKDIYFVGFAGSLVHYDGSTWQKYERVTATDLWDICGTPDGRTLWACGHDGNNFESSLLKYENGQWRTLWHREGTPGVAPFGYDVASVWRGSSTFVTSDVGVFRLDTDSTFTKISDNFGVFTYRIRGNADNDIVVVGDGGVVWHYNGASWRKVYQGNPNLTFYSCAIKTNRIIAVGTDNSEFLSKAVICMGTRK